MRNFWNKLTELKRTLLLSIIFGIAFLALSFIGLAFNQPGWIIGVAIGTLVELANIFLHFKGADLILQENKTGIFLLVFFVRMTLVIASFLFAVLMEYVAKISAFDNSIWGVVIGLLPMEGIIAFVLKGKKKNNDEEK